MIFRQANGFVGNNLVRDFLALNKVEILPWDPWGLMYNPAASVADDPAPMLDRLAELSCGGNEAFSELRSLYLSDPRLSTPPRGWTA